MQALLSRWNLALRASVLLLAVAAGSAQAYSDSYETTALNYRSFYLSPGETTTLNVSDGWRHLSRLFLRGYGYGGEAKVEIWVNGELRDSVVMPSYETTREIPIGEVTGSVTLRHVWGPSIWFADVKAQQSTRCFPAFSQYSPIVIPVVPVMPIEPSYPLPASNEAARLSREAIRLVDLLQPHANYGEYGTYLLPIKKVAARAYAASQGRGGVSQKTHDALLALKAQIEFASDYLDGAFEREAAFDLSVALKGLGDRLDQVLR